jgi:isopenicillin-N epimerase
VLAAQANFQKRMEGQLIQFLVRELPDLLCAVRQSLADLMGASADDLALVPNATTGVNTVLRSLHFEPGDELLVLDHEYNACRNALDFVAERSGARVVQVNIPFPIASSDAVVEGVLSKVTQRTRLLLIDHVTSPTGMVLPVAPIVADLNARGVDTLVDGAHALGMLPLNLEALGAAYYTANCHKWLCTPKGSAVLYVRPDRQPLIHPLAISHGRNMPLNGQSRFRVEFDWTGTTDPTPFLCIPVAIEALAAMVGEPWPQALYSRNRALAIQARALLCNRLGIDPPCPESMIGALAAIPLPDGDDVESGPGFHPLQTELLNQFHIEVPVSAWPGRRSRLIRISAQLYNSMQQYERLADALDALLPR